MRAMLWGRTPDSGNLVLRCQLLYSRYICQIVPDWKSLLFPFLAHASHVR